MTNELLEKFCLIGKSKMMHHSNAMKRFLESDLFIHRPEDTVEGFSHSSQIYVCKYADFAITKNVTHECLNHIINFQAFDFEQNKKAVIRKNNAGWFVEAGEMNDKRIKTVDLSSLVYDRAFMVRYDAGYALDNGQVTYNANEEIKIIQLLTQMKQHDFPLVSENKITSNKYILTP